MKKMMKRTAAAALSLAMLGGAMPNVPELFKLPDFSMTAEAASGYSYDSTTQTLTLKGSFDLDDIRSYSTKAKKVVSTSSAVFPKSDWLFRDWSAEEYDLTLGDFSSFDTANVITMYSMFEYCSSLESLDLSNFKTTSGIGMGYMLKGCTSLYILDISGMTKFSGNEMLEGCDNLYMLTFDQNLNRSIMLTQAMLPHWEICSGAVKDSKT